MEKPLISIVMSVFNTERFLRQSIESILNQTYDNFEFIIIDDGSRDKSYGVIKKYANQDKRIRTMAHKKNLGLIASLNEGISVSRGEYIARQDPDDISSEVRLERQVAYLEANPSVGIVGTNYHVINNDGMITTTTNVFTASDDIKIAEIFTNQFGHGTILARKSLLSQSPYDQNYKYAEDYDLWTRLAHETKLANLKEPLYLWRLHEGGVTASKTTSMQAQVSRIREREFNYFLKNRAKLRFFPFHPLSLRGGLIAYLNKKSALYRNLSLMFYSKVSRRKAMIILALALVLAPWEAKNYRQFFIILQKLRIAEIKYETI